MAFARPSSLNIGNWYPIFWTSGGANWRGFMRTAIAAAFFAIAFPVVGLADSERTPAPPDAKVFIIKPKDGATVSSPVTVKFGAEGVDIVPAGTDKPDSGHHHLLIDTKVTDFNSAIPKDDHHVHYGKGQTEATVALTPGKHMLQLLLGDKNHVPHNPPVESPVVTIMVK
jgi:hypothetical protein